MKESNYNFFFPLESNRNKIIAYNARLNNLGLLDKEKYTEYIKFQEDNNHILETELRESLEDGGFLIDENVDELKQIEAEMYEQRFSTNKLGLTIAPTSDCNFRCIYCYEKDSLSNATMNEETEENIVNFVKSRANTIQMLFITWYGGEPLLKPEIIERLSAEFKKICDKNNIEYQSQIITNGFLLNEDNIEILNRSHINGAQISIDGKKEFHDARRPLRGGKGTFDTIMKNLMKCKGGINFKISLRMNIDKNNVKDITSVLDILSENGLTDIITPYPALVHSSNGCYDSGECFSTGDYSDIELNLFKESRKKGFNLSYKSLYPSAIRGGCAATSKSCYVINANGDMYKCWEQMGVEKYKLGNINHSVNEDKAYFVDYLTNNIINDEECNSCKYLPICMGGGCPHLMQENSSKICTKVKDKLSYYLNKVVELIINS